MISRICIGLFGLIFLSSLAFAEVTGEELFRAIDFSTGTRVAYLLEQGADPNVRDPIGEPALVYAINERHLDSALVLVGSGKIELEEENTHGQNALMLAAYYGDTELVFKLIAAGAEINHAGWSPLHYAMKSGKEEILHALLEHDAYIDAEGPDRTTPLILAAKVPNRVFCKILIEAGADATISDQSGHTASDYATEAGDLELGAWLGRRAADFRRAHPLAPPEREAPADQQ